MAQATAQPPTRRHAGPIAAADARGAEPYAGRNKIRIVTAAALFDGHDAAINVMRRILQASGAEVIHLGHDRSVDEVVNCAIQEDANAIAMTSYQGGHVEYLKYMHDRLKEAGREEIRVFAGGGGVILPQEIADLHAYGIEHVYTPDDGRAMGLQGMINDLLRRSDRPIGRDVGQAELDGAKRRDAGSIARLISAAENWREEHAALLDGIRAEAARTKVPVLGITGTGGAGKSSLVDELVRRFLIDQPDRTIGIISVDPTKRKTGGALLGDRIRMNSINDPRVYMRSLATRQANLALSGHVRDASSILKVAGFDLVILETSGIGQSDTEIVDHSDVSLYVMTPDFGAPTQLEKIDMLDFADVVALNKFDKRGALDALRDVRKQYQRNHKQFSRPVEQMPVIATIASQFNDPGTTRLYRTLIERIAEKSGAHFDTSVTASAEEPEKIHIIPPDRQRYLSEITDTIRRYNTWAAQQSALAQRLQSVIDAERIAEGDAGDAPGEAGGAGAATRWREPGAARPLGRDARELRGTGVRLPGAGQVHPRPADERYALTSRRAESGAAHLSRVGRHSAVDPAGERPGGVPVHGGRLSLQARGRGSDADVRGGGRARAHEPALPLRIGGAARAAVVDGVRLGDVVRQ